MDGLVGWLMKGYRVTDGLVGWPMKGMTDDGWLVDEWID